MPRPHFLERELIHFVEKAKNVWLIVGRLSIKAGWWNDPLALWDFNQAINTKILTKCHPWFLAFLPQFSAFPPRFPTFPLSFPAFPAFPPWFSKFPALPTFTPCFFAFPLWFPTLDNPRSHTGSPRPYHSPHSVPRLPILAFTDRLDFVCHDK